MKPTKPTRSNGWTAERRAKQAEMIKNWQPWDKSTGPKSPAGKVRSSQNSFKHGVRSKAWGRLRAIMGDLSRQDL